MRPQQAPAGATRFASRHACGCPAKRVGASTGQNGQKTLAVEPSSDECSVGHSVKQRVPKTGRGGTHGFRVMRKA